MWARHGGGDRSEYSSRCNISECGHGPLSIIHHPLLISRLPLLGRTCLGFNLCDEPGAAQEASAGSAAHEGASGEPARGITPTAAPRTVREPLGSHRSRCSTVSMIQGPMSEEAWPCAAKPLKLVLGTLRPACHPLVFAAGPSNDTRRLFGR